MLIDRIRIALVPALPSITISATRMLIDRTRIALVPALPSITISASVVGRPSVCRFEDGPIDDEELMVGTLGLHRVACGVIVPDEHTRGHERGFGCNQIALKRP